MEMCSWSVHLLDFMQLAGFGIGFFPFIAHYPWHLCAILGVLIERIAYKRLRNATRIAALITAIGVSLLIEYGYLSPRCPA